MQITTSRFGFQFTDGDLVRFLETVNDLVTARQFERIKVQIKNTLFVRTGSSAAMPGLVRELHQLFKQQHPRTKKIHLQFTWDSPSLDAELKAEGKLIPF